MPRVLFSQGPYTKGISRSAEFEGEAVTPNNSTDLPGGPCDAIYVTGAGNVAVNLASGGTAVLQSLSAGQILRVNVARIKATSTTATGIFALYSASNP